MILLLIACEPAGETGKVVDDTDTPTPIEHVDVLVVGAGPAGMAAAITAKEAGAEVLVLDRDDEPGWGLITGGQAYAVGTRWQLLAGVEDSVEAAQADWATVTGDDPTAEGVVDFLTESAWTLEWVESMGGRVTGLYTDQDAGTLARIHQLDWSDRGDARVLFDVFGGEVRSQAEVTAPLMEGDAVVGVVWTDLSTGASFSTGAGAVVIATGGFLRNRAEVDRVMPEVAGRALVYEANYGSDGGGLPFLDAVGAARANPEQVGIYVHSIQDPEMAEGESVLVIGGERGILVDAAGLRFANEDEQRSLDLFAALPEGEIYGIVAGDALNALMFQRPAYNWPSLDVPDTIPLDELLTLTDEVVAAGSAEEVAALAGVDPDGLLATVEAWNDAVAAGVDPLGRDMTDASMLEGDFWVVVRLTPGLAKNFGGVATDVDAHVLDAAGLPIPGLYAAGEVAGMVLGGGGGDGFAGSVNACYHGGRVAGAQAAEFAGGG